MANERLISADALKRAIRQENWVKERRVQLTLDFIDIIIGEQPTVDAVEVVRCKDCKYFVQGEPYDPCECMKWIAKFAVAYTEPHGYCHKAERKDNG